MINEVMLVPYQDILNDCTKLIKDKSPRRARLRNGSVAEVMFEPMDPNNDSDDLFRTADWRSVWNLDGSSIRNNDLDIMEVFEE